MMYRPPYRFLVGLTVFATFLAIYVDFPIAKDRLLEDVRTFTPIGAAILPYLLLGVVASLGGYLLWLIARAGIVYVLDRHRDGPSVRKLKSYLPLIADCKNSLTDEMPLYFQSEIDERNSVLTEKLITLATGMNQLGIWTPFGVPEFNKKLWIVYLSRLQVQATYGNLSGARRLNAEMLGYS